MDLRNFFADNTASDAKSFWHGFEIVVDVELLKLILILSMTIKV